MICPLICCIFIRINTGYKMYAFIHVSTTLSKPTFTLVTCGWSLEVVVEDQHHDRHHCRPICLGIMTNVRMQLICLIECLLWNLCNHNIGSPSVTTEDSTVSIHIVFAPRVCLHIAWIYNEFDVQVICFAPENYYGLQILLLMHWDVFDVDSVSMVENRDRGLLRVDSDSDLQMWQ